MSAVVIEHVRVGDLPEDWRARLAKPADARVTVRIEDEPGHNEARAASGTNAKPVEDPAFGIWRDREDLVDVEAYLARIRAPR